MAKYVIASRNIIDRTRSGQRIREVRYGQWFVWTGGNSQLKIFKNAVIALINQVNRSKIGAILYRVKIDAGGPMNFRKAERLFQAKFGHDNEIFTSFYQPLGESFRVRAGLPARLEKWRNR